MTQERTVVRELFSRFFPASSFTTWRAAITVLFGLDPESEEERAVIRQCLGRQGWPRQLAREALFLCGRRAGKSLFAAFIAVWFACCRSYRGILGPGERGVVMIIAANRKQARVVKGYISGLIGSVPTLQALVERETQEAIVLTNGVTIEIHTASYRAIRGYTVVAAICDEICFWPTDDAANPDIEILNALRPAMATVPDALLLSISSPYGRRGEAWTSYSRHYGKEDAPVLVWQADTRTMNPTVPEAVIAEAYERDEAVAAAEYGAEFRRDLESLFSAEAVATVVATGRLEVPPASGQIYVGFCDPSGGSRDSMTLAIAHHDDGHTVLDVVREVKAPFDPDPVVTEFAALSKTYGLQEVTGDRYAGEWVAERFRAHDITYRASERTKSELYLALLPLINSGRAELLDDPRLLRQLTTLERRTSRSGRDSVDHPVHGRDDLANAAAGAHGGAYRTIPLDGRPHLPPRLRQWLGDARGRWEGDTLVVDTTNFSDQTNYEGGRENLHLVERFTLAGADLIMYHATIMDPTVFTTPWTIEIPLTKQDDQRNLIFESACHEGNYGLMGILAGARARDKTPAP